MIQHRLVTTLGTAWAIVPEAYGVFCGLYPDLAPPDVPPPEEVWIISTQFAWSNAEEKLKKWAELTGCRVQTFIHPDDDLTSTEDVRAMRELIFRTVLHASEGCRELSCSLAGGRKTMSADMQEAARIFGCTRLLHVLSNGKTEEWPKDLKKPSPDFFTKPLPKSAEGLIFPTILPGSTREDLLDVSWNTKPPITPNRFPLPPKNKVEQASSLSTDPKPNSSQASSQTTYPKPNVEQASSLYPPTRFFNPYAEIDRTQRNLPHWTQDKVTYFVTFRLADAIPQANLRQWHAEREAWLAAHPEPHDAASKADYYDRFSSRIEHWLDAGSGSCLLADPENSKIVADTIQHFAGERYELGDWVVMPNHVHALVTPLGPNKLSEILHSWKSYSARQINKRTSRTGNLWQHESYDHIARNAKALAAISHYIRENPAKAGIRVQHASSLSGEDKQDACATFENDQSIAVACATFSLDGLDSSDLLTAEIDARRNDSGLLTNFISAIESDERHENWRSLYRLPPRMIEQLRQTVIGESHEALLRSIPKAELHCHIGGILDIPQQRRVAEAIWEALDTQHREEAQSLISNLDWDTRNPMWHTDLKVGNRPANIAAVFQRFDDAQIEEILYPAQTTRTALKHRHPLGFTAYELPGELSGSAVLGHPAALAPTAAGILEYCQREGVEYLELRGSPHKYSETPLHWLHSFYSALCAQQSTQSPTVRFIWISDRRKPLALPTLVKAAAQARRELPDFLVGLDLAGDEGDNAPEKQPSAIAPHFLPAFEACLPITIHAGEGESAQNIWDAAYHLHADRIGHGLTLAQNPDLLTRFIDRKICLELCPTSNREVVGFRDPRYPESLKDPDYPLRRLWQAGIPLTLCTDNPGISRTTLAREYIAASRMIGGLSLWDGLSMMKQAFVHAFAETSVRERILKKTDQAIHRHITASPSLQ